MAGRRKQTATFSLFAFQDIITSVTGIMILVTLMLALELMQRSEGAPPNRTRELIEQMRETLQDVAAEVARLQSQSESVDEDLQKLAVLDATTLHNRREAAAVRSQALDEAVQKAIRQAQATQQQQQELQQRRESTSQAAGNELAQLEGELAEALEELESLRSSNRVVFNRPADTGNLIPWLVEFTASGILAAEMGVSRAPLQFSTSGAFIAWINQTGRSGSYFVLLVKPDSIDRYDSVVEHLLDNGFSYGVNLLDSDQSAIDLETGAAGR